MSVLGTDHTGPVLHLQGDGASVEVSDEFESHGPKSGTALYIGVKELDDGGATADGSLPRSEVKELRDFLTFWLNHTGPFS